MSLAATLAVCVAIVAASCGGESEHHENGDPGGGGTTGGTGGPQGGSLAIIGATGGTIATGGTVATGGSLATAGTTGAMGGSVAMGGSPATGGTGSDGGAGTDGGTGTDGGAGGAGGGAGAGDPSTEGCRGPRETGCATCCEPSGSNCVERTSSDGGDWYNVTSLLTGSCPESCPRCAPCSSREESDLRTLGCRADCDCENIVIGIDPCFSPQSCECYCLRTEGLLVSCPQIVLCD